MFGARTKIYTAYEKTEAAEPTDRVELVREGFSFWAFALNVVWLLAHRLWFAAGIYVALLVLLAGVAERLHVSPASVAMLQLLMQSLLGFLAYDLKRLQLRRHGYRFAGVIVAEDDLAAEQRYYAHAA